jgi:hypothetical protein
LGMLVSWWLVRGPVENIDMGVSPVRIAVDIGLNCDPPLTMASDGDAALATRTAERTWMTCFVADQR